MSSAAMPRRHARACVARLGKLLPAAFACILWGAGAAAADETDYMNVDAAVVFAVDMSSSIHAAEADLQRLGHADALRSREVEDAIARGATGCIAITYIEWSVPRWLHTVLPWTRICNGDDASRAASAILARGDTGLERRGRGGTAISYALEVSSLLLDRFPGHASRKIIDISANGTSNDGLPVARSRERVVAKRHIINAIVLARTEPGVTDDLPGYFRNSVIGGPGAFVIVPERPEDYAAALRRKLVLEVSGADPDGEPGISHLSFASAAEATAGRQKHMR